ncbi:MAG TPA: cation:proton antiporter, partial [Polyangiaceae bacterium]|nr:cation:proton antiporter [Polyangiaceae bacterium]
IFSWSHNPTRTSTLLMPHNLELISTLAGGLSAALIFGFLSQRVGLSPIVGYLVGGIAVGPFTPGFVANQHLAEQLAEVGVILLMFGVGLQFHLKELLAVRRVAIPGALAQIAVATGLGYLATRAFGWRPEAGVIFGLAISVASTVVLTRVLSDNRALNTPTGHIAVGWLVVEDIFTVLVLVLLPVIYGGEGTQSAAQILIAVAIAVVKLVALLLVAMLVGRRALPALLGYVARTRSQELFTLTVLVLALGLAVGSAQLFGASMALGAFLAGMIVGQSPFSARAASEALPLRDAFAVLFFVSVGMMFNPAELFAALPLTLTTLAIVIIGKPIAALLVVLLLRYPLRVALAVAVALAQVGEFSFILATLGTDLKVLPAEASRALVVAAIVSITINPLLYRAVKPVARWLTSRFAAKAVAPAEPVAQEFAASHPARAVLIGYGPIGRVLARLLRDYGMQPVIIELNYDTVSTLSEAGADALYGDATRPDILERAGVPSAASVIFTADGVASPAAIAEVRQLNPTALIMARAKYSSEVRSLEQAGADFVFSSEGEIALSMADRLLTRLGATRDEVHRERDRVRIEVPSSNEPAMT